MAVGENPVLETLGEMNAAAIARSELSPEALLLVRIAALVAVDAPVSSYLMHVGAAAETDLTLDAVQDLLVTVAPIVGGPRVLSAAAKITEALGIAIEVAVAEAELEAEAGA